MPVWKLRALKILLVGSLCDMRMRFPSAYPFRCSEKNQELLWFGPRNGKMTLPQFRCLGFFGGRARCAGAGAGSRKQALAWAVDGWSVSSKEPVLQSDGGPAILCLDAKVNYRLKDRGTKRFTCKPRRGTRTKAKAGAGLPSRRERSTRESTSFSHMGVRSCNRWEDAPSFRSCFFSMEVDGEGGARRRPLQGDRTCRRWFHPDARRG